MSAIRVRVLAEDDWQDYRAVRLASLQEAPQAFLANYADEADKPESYWRDRLRQAERLLAESEGTPLGVASLEMTQGTADSADFCDLWVTPAARNSGVASRILQAAIDQAVLNGCTKLYYWVSTENARAVGFAVNAGFRVTSQRRRAHIENAEFGTQEIALVLSLANDPGAVATSVSARLTPKAGPS
ncbi:MAG TPA: GNAT family N-acetyltransferase [Microlunatus sp.]|nr:GNAT family N-acetyltransferase [Microlunatus sp.]